MTRSSLVWSLMAFAACNGGGGGGCNSRIQDVACAPGAVAGVSVVSWTTELEGEAHVEYGLGERRLDTSSPGVPAADQEETLIGLKVATEYFMRVVVGDEASDVIECTTEPPPPTMPVFTQVVWNPDLACEDGGYVLFNFLGDHESGVGIVDRDGRLVWAVESEADVQFARARLGRDGRSILWNTNDFDRLFDIATIERMSIDGTTTTSTKTLNAHHDFLELPDGSMAFIGYGFVDPDEVGPGLTFDPEALGFPVRAEKVADVEATEVDESRPGDWDDNRLAYDRILEVPEGATDADVPTVVFDHLADWPEGIYHNHFNAAEKCDRFLPDSCELGHGNSLAYVPAEDRYRIGFRWLDALLSVDRAGAVQWVLGGPQTTLTGDPDDLPMHGHFSQAYPGGMRVYDNRDNDPPTRLVEYTIDEVSETFDVAWTVDKPPPPEAPPDAPPVADKVLGDFRKMPIEGCDNVLVSWSSDGKLQERTRDGQIVWEVKLPLGNITGRAQYLSSLHDFADQAYPE